MGCTSSKDAVAEDFTLERDVAAPNASDKTVSSNAANAAVSHSTAKKTKSANTMTASSTSTAGGGNGAGGETITVEVMDGSQPQQPQKQPKPVPQQTDTPPPATKPPIPRPKDSSAALSKADQVIAKTTFAEEYELCEMVGKGNYAVVHRVVERATGMSFAAKIMERAGLNQSDVRDIKEEVSILMELDHPNIIKVFGFYEDSEKYYIITELMAGGELFDEIVEREFYWERDAQEVVKMLADALDYMHVRGIVHRDMKPENVLLTSKGKDGIAKIADFGFAARTDTKIPEYQLSTPCGTPGYVAPEIVSGLKYGMEADMWSLGVIAFILLGGYPPFHDENQDELFRLIRRGKFTFDPTYWSLVSDEAKDCVQSLLTVDRSKRMQASDVKKHPWIQSVPETAEEGNTFGGVGGRGAGMEGRGTPGSVNLSPAIKELRKFQARRRWKDGMAIAMAREGQVFGNFTAMTSLIDAAPRPYRRMDDITQLPGLGTSDVLTRLQIEKRQRGTMPAQF